MPYHIVEKYGDYEIISSTKKPNNSLGTIKFANEHIIRHDKFEEFEYLDFIIGSNVIKFTPEEDDDTNQNDTNRNDLVATISLDNKGDIQIFDDGKSFYFAGDKKIYFGHFYSTDDYFEMNNMLDEFFKSFYDEH